ncbi:MAG: methionine--tRNA ligase [Chitinophagaceae bacterium]
MNKPERYLVTSALPYANGLKHIGHLAGAYLPADIYVRYLRAQKRDVVYVSGSDEHGAAITIQAMKEGTTPGAIVDKYHEILKSNLADLGISFDIYHRTTAAIHHETAREFFTSLYKKGELEEQENEQYFDEEANTFLADRYIVGTCPVCGYDNAFGDQCEKCGSSLSPDQLINPRSTLSGNSPVKKLTRHWYLPLNKHETWLREWILGEHAGDWKTNVLGQCKSWIDAGLQPRAVTRDLDWGVPVPLKEAEGKVLYVWFDAPIGYISATRQWAIDNNRDWEPYWKDRSTKLVHFIGKDNIVFHCIIFPVMLRLHGNIIPDNVPSNEFMNLEGDKMSTSRGWSIEMDNFINDWIKKDNGGDSMVDTLRYYLTTISPETKDSEFTWKGFQDANNNELVSIFGNFVNRSFVLLHKLCKGKIPVLHTDILNETDKTMMAEFQQTRERVEELLEKYKFRDALFEIIDLSRKGNRFMQEKQPWIVARSLGTNPDAAQADSGKEQENMPQKLIDNCMHICLQLTANLAILVNPFMPFTAKKMCHMMKVVNRMLDWENAGKTKLLSVGYNLRDPQLLFRKIDDTEIAVEVEKLKTTAVRAQAIKEENLKNNSNLLPVEEQKPEAVNLKPQIEYEDFAKLDLKVGTIASAEKMEKADKLLKLEIDLGFEKRVIISGIALHFNPEDIIGRQVVVVANLAPRKMRGVESNGMILMAEDDHGKLHFILPEQVINNGSGVS